MYLYINECLLYEYTKGLYLFLVLGQEVDDSNFGLA